MSRRPTVLTALAAVVMAGTAAVSAAEDVRVAIEAGSKAFMAAAAHGDTAHEVGAWATKGNAGATAETGKYIVIWKKEGGQWRLHRDIWNSSTPPPAK